MAWNNIIPAECLDGTRFGIKPDLIFITNDGDKVKIDRDVPGDATKWYVANWCNGHWIYDDDTIEPSDLKERVFEN